MTIATLADFYLDQLQDIHSCETQIIKALPKMSEAAHHPRLKAAFDAHLEQTKIHLERLTRIFHGLKVEVGGKVCAATAGLIKETEELTGSKAEDEARDAGLICAAQKIEHYEIATYGCLRTYASLLGRTADAELLGTTLIEEKKSDRSLTALAVGAINDAALEEGPADVAVGASDNGTGQP